MSRSRFSVVAFEPDSGELLASVSGRDPYLATAEIIVEAASRLRDGVPSTTGFTSPPALFETRDFLASVGLDW